MDAKLFLHNIQLFTNTKDKYDLVFGVDHFDKYHVLFATHGFAEYTHHFTYPDEATALRFYNALKRIMRKRNLSRDNYVYYVLCYLP
jgi:hypothetical protein